MNSKVLKWKNGKAGVFYLAFDDSCVSQVDNAIPALIERGLIGTFYINPGTKAFADRRDAWETWIPKADMVYGNHTFTHAGAPGLEIFKDELQRCQKALELLLPNEKTPRLISFARPGVPAEKWQITNAEKDQALIMHNLIQRPPYFGPPFNIRTRKQLISVIDSAVNDGALGHIDLHGVGGDWHIIDMDDYIAVLDKLAANKENLWITDPLSYHKYMTERSAAIINDISPYIRPDNYPDLRFKQEISISLSCRSNSSLPGQELIPYHSTLYDMPLTLSTEVPISWETVKISQNNQTTVQNVKNNTVCYNALPDCGKILIQPSS